MELRESLPEGGDPELDRYAAALRQVFDHHVLLLKTSLGLLAAGERCEALGRRVGGVYGLGAPARRLEAIRFELLRREVASSPGATDW